MPEVEASEEAVKVGDKRKRRMRKMADMGEGGDNDARIESNLDDELAESALKR
jgi:hypothetical protein